MEAGASPEPLTFEEFVNLNPALIPPPIVLERLIQYRSMVDAQLPQITTIIAAYAAKLKSKGFNVPARFLPTPRVSQDEMLKVVEDLYRKYLVSRLG